MKRYIAIVLLCVATLCSADALAQRLNIGFIYPAGGARGSVVDVELGGLNIKSATAAKVSGEGVRAEIIPLPKEADFYVDAFGKKRKKMKKLNDQSAPQLADRVGLRITIDKNAELGLRNLRLQSPSGESNQLSFEVGQYPNIVERQGEAAGFVNEVTALPATLCGYVKAGEVDRFSFTAEEGMELVAEVKGRALVPYIADAVPGWFQPIIKLTNSAGREVAFADDYRTSPDPVLRYTVEATDSYTLSIHDAIFRGREDFNYRIQVGEIPFVESAYPIVVQEGVSKKIEVSGRNLSKDVVKVKPSHSGVNHLRVKGTNGKLSNAVPYWAVERGESIIEQPTAASELREGVMIYDHFDSEYGEKSYTLPLAAGEAVRLDVMSRRMDSRADIILSLVDPDGERVARSDDVEDRTQGLMTHHADPVINFKATKGGVYRVVVEEAQGGYGRDYSFLLRKLPPAAPFEAFVNPANVTIASGGTSFFNLTFNYISPKDLNGVKGIRVSGLPEGYRVGGVTTTRRPKFWKVSISAPKGAKQEIFPIVVEALGQSKSGEMVVEARAVDNMTQAFYYIHNIPAVEFTAEVVEQIPYSVHFESAVEEDLEKPIVFSREATTIPLKIIVDREEGFDDELELELGMVNKRVTLEPVKMLRGESEKVINVKLDRKSLDKIKSFRQQFYVVATLNGEIQKQGQRTFVNAKYRAMTPIIMIEQQSKKR